MLGKRWVCGSGLGSRGHNIAADNAFLIDRLLQAGAIVFGKTNVPYMLADAQSYNEIYGTTINPWDATRSPAPRLVRRRGGDTRRRAVRPLASPHPLSYGPAPVARSDRQPI